MFYNGNMNYILKLIRSTVIVYILLIIFLYLYQGHLLYLPSGEYVSPQNRNLTNIEELKFKTSDNIEDIAWFVKPASADKDIIVYFHGNASNLYSAYDSLLPSLKKYGYGALIVEYRGYSQIEGEPSEKGLYEDSRSAIKALLSKHNIAENKLILLGRSLGSGIAVKMATEFNTKLLALISPYKSITAVAQREYWYVPVKYLLHDHYNVSKIIPNVEEKILIFHGTKDPLIPIEHGRELYNLAKSEKIFFPLKGYNHHNVNFGQIIDLINNNK